MGTNLNLVLQRELENLDKGEESRRSAMKSLNSYVKELSSRTIPLFLAQLSEAGGADSSHDECTISLCETLARVHGPVIVPHVDQIMSIIARNLLPSTASFELQQACCDAVAAISRYGIDPLTTDHEKTKIIRTLAKPLSDMLMGPREAAASGAALCLQALLESDNWRFAPDDVVNEICLKVAGALEEKPTQTNAHMDLVMALMKMNALVAEPYARSLIRSGLQILDAAVGVGDSQKQLLAIQMINFLMEGVDCRSISSEIVEVVDIMEKCQHDDNHSVRIVASEALQTAELIAAQKVSRPEICSSPVKVSSFERRIERRHSLRARDNEDPEYTVELHFPESKNADSFSHSRTVFDSSMSNEQLNFEHSRRAIRRLWNSENSGQDTTLKDGFFHKASSSSDDGSGYYFEHSGSHKLSEMQKVYNEQSKASSEFVQPNAVKSRATTPSPQRSRPPFSVGIKISSNTQKLIQSLRSSSDANSGGLETLRAKGPMSNRITEAKFNPARTLDEDNNSQNSICEVNRKNVSGMRQLIKREGVQEDAEILSGGVGSTTSISNLPADDRAICRSNKEASMSNVQRKRYSKAALISTVCCLLVAVFIAIFASRRIETDDGLLCLVPT